MRSMLKLVLLPLIFIFSISIYSTHIVEASGEIPWPLSNQRVITMNNSRGLWRLESSRETKFYNVEMIENESGTEWIRVAELDSKTLEVISWGEGFYSNCKKNSLSEDCTNKTSVGSFANLFLKSVGNYGDQFGRYVDMFPNGDIAKDAYLLRLVEVKTSVGNVLGLSIIDYIGKNYDHFLGTRLIEAPLTCHKVAREGVSLICDFSLKN